MKYILKTADYVKNFSCIGGECLLTCCQGNNILWLPDEYEKLVNSNCSAELREAIKDAFIPYGEPYSDSYKIKLGKDGVCPMCDKNDGLCMVQKELGADYLSITGRDFPLYGTYNDHIICETRQLGCPTVFDIITENENACDYYIYNDNKRDFGRMRYHADLIDDVKNNPVLKYRNILFDFFYGIMSDKYTDIKTSMAVCLLAAQKLTEFEKKSPDSIPSVIKELIKQSKNPELTKAFNDIKPNYAIKFGMVNASLDFLCNDSFNDTKALRDIHAAVHDGRNIYTENYIEASERFYNAFNKKPFFMKNICRTLFANNLMPLKSSSYTILENFAYFALVVGVAEHIGVCSALCYKDEETVREQFKYALCGAARRINQNNNFFNLSMEHLKNNNFISVGKIILLLK